MAKKYILYKEYFKEEYGRWWPCEVETVDSAESWSVILGVAHDMMRYGSGCANYYIKVFEDDNIGKFVWQCDQFHALPDQNSFYELDYRQEYDWRCFVEPELFAEDE